MTEPTANMTVDGDRLWDSLMEMARIGPGVAGGNNRQTVTDEDGEGRDAVPAMAATTHVRSNTCTTKRAQ